MTSADQGQLEALKQRLVTELGQAHLFAESKEGVDEMPLLEAAQAFNNMYPGGLAAYIEKSKKLLADSAAGKTALGDSHLSVPKTVFHAPKLFSDEWAALELKGLEELKRTVFVLVAGGLGERLGFSDIKLSLPVETASGKSYIDHYFSWMRATVGVDAFIVIMTSDDTDTRTRALLASKKNFGMTNITILKQETVPCLGDNNASLVSRVEEVAIGAGEAKKKLVLVKKPHGHGDVHHLIHQSDVPNRAEKAGMQHIAFMQDTNAAATLTVPISLAVSKVNNLGMNLTCVPRLPGDAVGSLCHVSFPSDPTRQNRVCNVEYNVLGPILQATTGKGDVAVEGSKFSAFPGSVNTLLLSMPAYLAAMKQSHGLVPEFVNPKYADSTKTAFKSPTRLETLMQDVALMLEPTQVGGTVFDRVLYHPVKNSLVDAAAKVAQGLDAHAACSGEEAVFTYQRLKFDALGDDVAKVERHSDTNSCFMVNGAIPVQLFPMISFSTSFAVGQDKLKKRFVGSASTTGSRALSMTASSTLLLSGDITIKSLVLDGALSIAAPDGVKIVVDGLVVRNEGWKLVPLQANNGNGRTLHLTPEEESALTEVDRIRGYIIRRVATTDIKYVEPGEYVINHSSKI